MFPPFVTMLIGLGTPPALAVYSLVCVSNLMAGLTHYGTTVGRAGPQSSRHRVNARGD